MGNMLSHIYMFLPIALGLNITKYVFFIIDLYFYSNRKKLLQISHILYLKILTNIFPFTIERGPQSTGFNTADLNIRYFQKRVYTI